MLTSSYVWAFTCAFQRDKNRKKGFPVCYWNCFLKKEIKMDFRSYLNTQIEIGMLSRPSKPVHNTQNVSNMTTFIIFIKHFTRNATHLHHLKTKRASSDRSFLHRATNLWNQCKFKEPNSLNIFKALIRFDVLNCEELLWITIFVYCFIF